MNKLHKLCYKYEIDLHITYGNGENHWYIDAYEFGGQSWHVKKIRNFNDACGYIYNDILNTITKRSTK
jgi:hypothetical protein|tara:strand:+ start:390 stop:593 length:204 start_codon:yes stop_codon:yes gene_type:complete